MKYIKTFEDNKNNFRELLKDIIEEDNFDPNNFNKLLRDIKGITIELKDKGFRILPFEVESDIGFDNYDYYVKICKRDIYNALFQITDVKDYIYTIMDYVDLYYEYDELTIKVASRKINELAYVYFESNSNKRVDIIELYFSDIKKK